MRQMDVKLGKVVYTPVLTPRGGFRSDLTVMRLGDEHFRVVTGGAHGMADLKWYRDHLPEDGTAQIFDLTSSWTHARAVGPAGARHPRLAHERGRLARGLPVRHLRDDRDGPAARARVADLVRRRPRLGAVRADRAGRAAVGHGRRGGRAARDRARRASASTAPPAGSRSATARSASSSTASTTWSRPGMAWGKVKDQDFVGKEAHVRHREEEPATHMCALTVDDHTLGERREALHARRRADRDARRRAARGRPRPRARTSRARARGPRSASTS